MRKAKPMFKVDVMVFMVCVVGFGFVLGMEYGIDEAKNKLATQCLQQPGEQLLSTIQERTSVHCIYSRDGYGLAKAKRRAT